MSYTREQQQLIIDEAQGEPLAIVDPYMLLCLFYEQVREQLITLYQWQIDTLKQFAIPNNGETVNRMCLCASNGSGKSQIIVAPCAAWACVAHKRARVVITSSSGDQVDNQICSALNHMCREINRIRGREEWMIKYRKYEYLPTGSTVELYATDDPGKAEGYHAHVPGGLMIFIGDEAKSIPEDIFKATIRYTDVTHRFYVSSPGRPSGTFYRAFTNDRWWNKRVLYTDCPRHYKQDEVDEVKKEFGEFSATFRSIYLAEFTSEEEKVVLTFDALRGLFDKIRDKKLRPCPDFMKGKRAGIDLSASAGGDECVFSWFIDNIQQPLITWRSKDTTVSTERIKTLIDDLGIAHENIYADDGGIGKPIIDNLWSAGYLINRVLNQNAPIKKAIYGNRGAEMWFSFKRYVEEGYIHVVDDPQLREQLSTRYYTEHKLNNKTVLESKEDARSAGRKSPDRADATVLAWCGLPFSITLQKDDASSSGAVESKGVTMDDIVRMMDKQKYDLNKSGAVHPRYDENNNRQGTSVTTYVGMNDDTLYGPSSGGSLPQQFRELVNNN